MSEVPNSYIDCNSTFSPNLVHDISPWGSNNDEYFDTSTVHATLMRPRGYTAVRPRGLSGLSGDRNQLGGH